MDLSIKSHSIANKVLTKEKKAGISYHGSKPDKTPKPNTTAGETTNGGTNNGNNINA